jgi:hypothetical protein
LTFRDPGAAHVSVAQIRPGNRRQIVSGHTDGRVRLRTWREATPPKLELGPTVDLVEGGVFSGKVAALAFSSDGRHEYLTAAGDGTSMWWGAMTDPRPARLADQGPRPHHLEQINTLIAWPSPGAAQGAATATVISGSDDTTVRIWELKEGAPHLRGTFTPASVPAEDDAPADPTTTTEMEWVVFTPDGHFDASARGRKQLRFPRRENAGTLDQLDGTRLYSFDLGQRLLSGQPFDKVPELEEPPPIAIEAPAVDPDRPETQLTITLGSRDQHDVRLYHNDVPIRNGLEAEAQPGPGDEPPRITIPVALATGLNTFYAMATVAAPEGSPDSRSPDLEVPFDGPTERGRLHVVALGVGDYQRRRLGYPDRDAEHIAAVLHEHGFQAQGKSGGARIVRTNGDVTPEGVQEAFRDVADQVKGRPQDTVVVFLAGHTGVFDNNRFGLLLPSYKFPAQDASVSQTRDGVVFRSSSGGRFDERTVLPYALIERGLMRLDALNRLVIVDACQAEAINDDAEVQNIRKWVEIRNRRARTSYLMAARRGEPALEIEGLRHGLFTYALLRGMGPGALDRSQEPEEIRSLGLPEDADFNHDGIITTGELDEYAHRALPRIAQSYPHLVARSRAGATGSGPSLEQDLRLQSTNVSFALIPLAGGIP